MTSSDRVHRSGPRSDSTVVCSTRGDPKCVSPPPGGMLNKLEFFHRRGVSDWKSSKWGGNKFLESLSLFSLAHQRLTPSTH